MPFGYTPEDERDDEPPDFVRMQQELADLDVGPQEEDDAAPAPVPVGRPDMPGAVPSPAPPRPLRDDMLQQLQGKARATSQRANLGRVGDEIAAAFGGYKPDESYWDNVEKQGKQPVADLLQSHGLQRQGALDAQNADLNLLRMKALLAKAQAKPKPDAHALKTQDDEAAAVGLRDFIRKTYGPELAEAGIDQAALNSYPKATLDKVVEGIKAQRGLEHHDTNAGEGRKVAREGHDIARQGLGVRKEQFENTLAQNKVAGFEQDPENPHVMQAAEAKELGEAKSARNNIDTKVEEAMRILDKHKGIPISPSGDDTAELQLIMGEILPLLTTSSGMKSFTEGHAHVFTDAMGTPISLANFVNSGRLRRQLETLKHSAHVAVETMSNSMGQREQKAGARAPSSGATPMPPNLNLDDGGKKVRLVGPDGTPHEWDAGDPEIKQALANGWKKVQ